MHESQQKVEQHPYSIIKRLELAKWYDSLGFPDLAAGEAYLALLLIDEVDDESGEYYEQASEAARLDVAEARARGGGGKLTVREWLDDGTEEQVYCILATSLYSCGCFSSALDFCKRGSAKLSSGTRDSELEKIRGALILGLETGAAGLDAKTVDFDNLPDEGRVRREVYPWNDHEPDRCSDETIEFLNEQLSKVAPKLQVRAVELPDLGSGSSSRTLRQLGLYAKVDIAPGEQILDEKSLLTATNRLLSEVCDACSRPRDDAEQETSTSQAYCQDCTDTTVFCSNECYDLAMSFYHPAMCDTDALVIAKDPKPRDAANAMYAQLLLRVFATSITQDVHPLDLPEIKYLCGEFSPAVVSTAQDESSISPKKPPRTLPFTFHHNIQLPLHFLEKMDVNIYEPPAPSRYSTSVANMLYAKLRGVASAKQDTRTGLPDVAAVHPLWCLANHSCAPNVRWEWSGNMHFWARDEPVAWGIRRDGAAAAEAGRGIKAGEEILSHYCDIDLPVKERREWAAGALGGDCRCERCLWEVEHAEQSI